MKKIVVMSDTHGNISAIEKILPVMRESDIVIHLGDYKKDILPFKEEIKELYSLKGNCDCGAEEKLIEVEGMKIFLTHGNRYGVKSSVYKLLLRAKELGANAVFYGHTHSKSIEVIDGITFINPGCMKFYGECTYCYTVAYNNKLTSKIVEIY